MSGIPRRSQKKRREARDEPAQLEAPALSGEELDRIGAMGENRFKDLCDRARLICTRPVPDKTGKDFTVEFPLELFSAAVSYDNRKAPIKVAAQVKTVTAQRNPAVLKLTAAERLARDSNPAIICLFVYDVDVDDIVDMRFIHIIGDNLGRILYGLRRAYAAGNKTLNRATVTFPAKLGFEVAMDATAITAALRSLSAAGMESYSVEKQRQILTAGYDDDRFKLSFSFSDHPANEIVDAFLGLRDLPVDDFKVAERRFNIELPAANFDVAVKGTRLSVSPEPIDECELLVGDPAANSTVGVPAEVFLVPAGLVEALPTYLFKWAMGHAKVNYSSKTFSVTINWDNEHPRTVKRWADEVEFVKGIVSRPCKMSAKGRGFVADLAEFEWSLADGMDWLKPIDRLVAASLGLFEDAGLGGVEFTMAELVDSRRNIAVLEAMSSRNIKLTTESDDWDMPLLDQTAGLFISAAQIAGRWVGLAMPMTISTERSGGIIQWTCYKIAEPTFSVLDGDVDEGFDRFTKGVQKLSRPECTFVQKPGNFLGDEGMILHTDLIASEPA